MHKITKSKEKEKLVDFVVSYEGFSQALDEKICTAVGRPGDGFGFDLSTQTRDLNWGMAKSEAERAAKRVKQLSGKLCVRIFDEP